MAKNNKKTWTPKRVRSEEERGGGRSEYIRLDEGERFTGVALFEGDPAKNETGYYEYMEHFDVNARRSVPCSGDECPLCEDGDRPKVRALTLWAVTKDEKGHDLDEPKLRIFQANWNVIKILTDMRSDDDPIKGQSFKISRLDDRGNYMLTLRPKGKMSATEVKELLKSDEAPDFDAMVTNRLQRAMEGYSVRKALDDDEDEDELTEKPEKTKKKSKDKDSEAAEWPEEADDVVVTVDEVDDNTITVSSDDYEDTALIYGTDEVDFTDLEAEATITVSWITDGDGDKVATEFEAEEGEPEPEAQADLPKTIEDEVFEVTGEVDEENGAIPVKSDDLELEFMLYVLEGVDVDLDDFKVGTKIKITAEKDVQGDMVISDSDNIEVVKAKKSDKKTGGKKSTAKKKPAKKK